MEWLTKLKEYAPDIAMAVISGGATLPALAMKAVADATGQEVTNNKQMESAILGASPDVMLSMTQANNSFKIRMKELSTELAVTELADINSARVNNKHSVMPAVICAFLTFAVSMFAYELMSTTIPPENVRIIDTLFGAYLTAWLSSIAYWVGTTRGSADKDNKIK